jgi:hypothetical protein
MNRHFRMSTRTTLAAIIVMGLAVTGCDYIVPPIDDSTPTPAVASQGWSAIATSVTEAGGSLRVDLSIQNNTGDWSAMNVSASKARVADSAGKTTECNQVFVGTSVFVSDGGRFLPPGFVMKGYTGGTVGTPATQLLYVECAGVSKAAGLKLAIDYSYITGPWDYNETGAHPIGAKMNLDLDKVTSDIKYPVAAKVGRAIAKPGDAIPAINNCTLTLVEAARTATGLEFTWKATNPTDYTCTVHIGAPPVIGSDGVLYGFYASPHQPDPPDAPALGTATWKTTVAVPAEVTGLYVLPSVEFQQAKYFVSHAVDITDK